MEAIVISAAWVLKGSLCSNDTKMVFVFFFAQFSTTFQRHLRHADIGVRDGARNVSCCTRNSDDGYNQSLDRRDLTWNKEDRAKMTAARGAEKREWNEFFFWQLRGRQQAGRQAGSSCLSLPPSLLGRLLLQRSRRRRRSRHPRHNRRLRPRRSPRKRGLLRRRLEKAL
jgi:hypothetical protein